MDFILNDIDIPASLQDKIFEIRSNSDGLILKIISYFPFSELEKQNIISVLNQPNFSGFHSIFTDYVSEDEWSKTKDQIKNRFRNELFDIDDTS